MEPWIKNLSEEQINQGVKCPGIKQRGTERNVYLSTAYWDTSQNKAIKTSKYIGKLDQARGLIKSHEGQCQKAKAKSPTRIKSTTEYGNALLLYEAMKDLKSLLIKGFPDNWLEIDSLSILRVVGDIPLKIDESAW